MTYPRKDPKIVIILYWLILIVGTSLFAGYFLYQIALMFLTWGPTDTELLIIWLQTIGISGLLVITCLGTMFSMIRVFEYFDKRGKKQ